MGSQAGMTNDLGDFSDFFREKMRRSLPHTVKSLGPRIYLG